MITPGDNNSNGAWRGQAVPDPGHLQSLGSTSNRRQSQSSSPNLKDCKEYGVRDARTKFENGDQYKNYLGSLVKREAWFEKMTKRFRSIPITVSWSNGPNKTRVANFVLPMDNRRRVAPGDRLKLKYIGKCNANHSAWQSTGNVIKFTAKGEVAMELPASKVVPFNLDNNFSVDFICTSTCLDRMLAAMEKFCLGETHVCRYIYERLLGNEAKAPLVFCSLLRRREAKLDRSQIIAIKRVLQRPLSLIWGLPGTGKTNISVKIARHLSEQNGGKVLVCANRNTAVDHLARKINCTGLKVVRLCAKSKEELNSPARDLTLHYQAWKMLEARFGLTNLCISIESEGALSQTHEKKSEALKRAAELEILKRADIICCTCFGAGDRRLNGLTFRRVLIDDAQQATEPESIIPLIHGCEQLVLVGDHYQLGPVVKSTKVAHDGLKQSLFERLVRLGEAPHLLKWQHRMHPCLSKFPSASFYGGKLKDGRTVNRRSPPRINFPWPNSKKPMFFYTSSGQEEASTNGKSYINREEAVKVIQVVSKLISCGAKPSEIGVMTPYTGQREYIVESLVGSVSEFIEVEIVEFFQGQEKDYIILSCVSSHGVRNTVNQGIGPLSDPNRLNVALTRARLGMIIVGNPQILGTEPQWNNLLTHFKEQECLVEENVNLKSL